MITRLEIDGFKSFSNFSIDFSPFTVIVGANASGKSNIFDALTLLSRLATLPVAQALAEGRGEPADQFRRHGDRASSRMSFAVELLLDKTVTDAFGAREDIPHTRLRYSITIEERPGADGITRPWVEHESIVAIAKGSDPLQRRVSEDFAARYLKYGATRWKILATEGEGTERKFTFTPKRSGSNAGHPRHLPAGNATASVLTSVGSVDVSPLLFAVRREMERWRVLQLDPAALRQPSPTGQPGDRLRRDGANLAWILRVIDQAASAGWPGLPTLSADLTRVIKGFAGVDVNENRARRQWEVTLRSRDEGEFSASVASDGTLRLLAVLAALYEPAGPGVICFEEPENGIQPARLGPLLRVLRDLVTDLREESLDTDDIPPMVQLLVSSHAPKLVVTSDVEELVVVDSVAQVGEGGVSRVTRARSVLAADEDQEGSDTQLVLPFSVRAELTGLTKDEAQAVVDAR